MDETTPSVPEPDAPQSQPQPRLPDAWPHVPAASTPPSAAEPGPQTVEMPVIGPAAYPPPPPPPVLLPTWTPTAPPPPPPGAPGPSAGAPKGARRTWLVVLGAAVLVVGLAAAGVMFGLTSTVEQSTVEGFARAPVGCTTTLEFDRTGEFTLYVETKGQMSSLDGDCDAPTSYEWTDDNPPTASLTLNGPDGTAVEVAASEGLSYDTGDFVGTEKGTVSITETGTYRLTVASTDSGFAVAVGGDPEADSSTLTTSAVVVAIAAVVIGLLLVLLGLRRRTPPAPPSASRPSSPAGVPGWQPQAPVPGVVSPSAPPGVPLPPSPPVAPPPMPPTGDASP